MSNELVEKYWQLFLKQENNSNLYGGKVYSAWYFGDNEKDANELVSLVIEKIKQGTASLFDAYIYEQEEFPHSGDVSIITDWNGNPQCIIETTKVELYKFKDVPESFAHIEGEGDKTLTYWKKIHNNLFSEEAFRIGIEFNENSMVFCEQFKLIYSK